MLSNRQLLYIGKKGDQMRKTSKRVLPWIMAFMLIFGQAVPALAAIQGIIATVSSATDYGTTVKASVYADSASDLQNNAANVTYSVYRDGTRINSNRYVDYAGPVEAVSSTVYKRDYQFTVNKSDYSSTNGNYSVVTQAVGNSVYNSNSVDVFSITSNRAISGTLSLPNNQVAPVGGLSLYVNISNGINYYEKYVTIPQGSNSVPYEVYVKKGMGYKVQYKGYWSDSPYASNGYYTPVGTSIDAGSAALLDASNDDLRNINLTLILNNVISGTVSLPSGVAPKGGMSLEIIASNSNYDESKYISIPEGSSTVAYSVYVAPGSKYSVWYANVWYPNSWNEHVYAYKGYYSTAGTVRDSNSASYIDVICGSQDNINLTLIPNNVISGTLTLPTGVAPNGGRVFWIHSSNGNGNFSKLIVIPEGSSTVAYSVYVVPGSRYKVWYDCSGFYEQYAGYGYYSTLGTVRDERLASYIDVMNGNQENINLVPITNNVISGTVSLPSGVAPKGGISLSLCFSNAYYYDSERITIPEGMSSVAYSVYVAPGSGYMVRYDNYWSDQVYASYGYYSTSGTVSDKALVSYIDVTNGNQNNVNLVLIPNNVITGTVSLPSGVAPIGGISLSINTSDGIEDFYKNISIPEGKSSVSYSVYVAPGSQYKVWYNRYGSYEQYARYGYYSTSGTVSDVSLSSNIDVTYGNQHGVDLVLIQNNVISGTISLPSGVAPKGGISLGINISNGKDNFYKDISIPEGSSTVSYSVYVVPGMGYRIWYYNGSYEQYARYGYYNTMGTVPDDNSSSYIDVANGNQDNVNLVLILCNIISGTVSLPSGVAPVGGIDLSIYSSNNTAYGSKFIQIPAGSSTVNYSVYVAPGSGYKVGYDIYPFNKEYTRYGYYSIEGTVPDYDSATYIDITKGNKNNVNLVLIRNNVISGTLSLPNGSVAPQGGMLVKINLWHPNMKIYDYCSLTIPEGGNSVSYSVYAPPVSGYTIFYNTLYPKNEYIPYGYYSITGTVFNPILASSIDINNGDISDIDLSLIKNSKVRGAVYLPEGVAPPGGINCEVWVENSNFRACSYVFIPEGSNSESYVVYVPPSNDYKIAYKSLSWLDNKYLYKGYYNKNGTTCVWNYATLIDASNDVSNINLTLIPSETRSINGVISLPENEVSPYKGINVTLDIWNGQFSTQTEVYIPEGKNSAEYNLSGVPAGTGYKLEYAIKAGDSANKYLGSGYYNAAGVVKDPSQAGILDLNSDNLFDIRINIPYSTPGTGTDSSNTGGEDESDDTTGGTTPDTQLPPDTVTDKVIISATLNSETKEAIAVVSLEALNNALKAAKENKDGVKTVTVEVSKAGGALAYVTQLPAQVVTSNTLKNNIQIKTDIGTIVVSSKMLASLNTEGAETVEIKVASAEPVTYNKLGLKSVIELSVTVDGKATTLNHSHAPFTVSIPYTPSGLEINNSEHIVVMYMDGKGKIKTISNGRYDVATGTVTFKTKQFGKYGIAYVLKTFDDIAGFSWAKKQIEVMASKGIIEGRSETLFDPSSDITRADFIKLLVQTFGFEAEAGSNFNDVNHTDYYYETVNTAKQLGLTDGVGNNNFDPKSKITRQDMMVIIARALKLAGKPIENAPSEMEKFNDKSEVAQYAADSVAALVKEGIVEGNGNLVRPKANATRAETAVLLYRIYNR